MFKYLCSLAMIGFLSLFSQAGTLLVKVIGPSGELGSGVLVKIGEEGDITQDNGEVKFEDLREGFHRLRVLCPHGMFLTVRKWIYVSDREDIEITVGKIEASIDAGKISRGYYKLMILDERDVNYPEFQIFHREIKVNKEENIGKSSRKIVVKQKVFHSNKNGVVKLPFRDHPVQIIAYIKGRYFEKTINVEELAYTAIGEKDIWERRLLIKVYFPK
jgi:hypothetical protein